MVSWLEGQNSVEDGRTGSGLAGTISGPIKCQRFYWPCMSPYWSSYTSSQSSLLQK